MSFDLGSKLFPGSHWRWLRWVRSAKVRFATVYWSTLPENSPAWPRRAGNPESDYVPKRPVANRCLRMAPFGSHADSNSAASSARGELTPLPDRRSFSSSPSGNAPDGSPARKPYPPAVRFARVRPALARTSVKRRAEICQMSIASAHFAMGDFRRSSLWVTRPR